MPVRYRLLACLALAGLTLAGCDDGTGLQEPAVAEVRISPPGGMPLAIGDTLRLVATTLDARGAPVEAEVEWIAAQPAIASVDNAGLVTARAEGAAVVRAVSEGRSDSVTVLVAGPPTSGAFEVVAPDALRQGDLVTLTATLGGLPRTTGVSWELVDAGAGLLDAAGRFVAYADGGSVRVAASYGGRSDTASIAIQPRGLSGTFSQVGHGPVTERFTSDLWVHGNHALTGTWACRDDAEKGSKVCGNRVSVWDVSDPARPNLTDSLTFYHPADRGQTINDVKISAGGDFAVVTHENIGTGGNGFTILDLSDPAHPTKGVHYTRDLDGGVHNVWIETGLLGRDYVFVVENQSPAASLHIIDVTDRAAPVERSTFGGSSPCPAGGFCFLHDVYVRDGLAFLSQWSAGLVILDVGNGIKGGSPSNPQEVSRIAIPGYRVHNAWYWPEAGYVFLGDEFLKPGTVKVVDVADIADPVEVAEFQAAGASPHNFWLDEARGVLFAAWYGQGVRAIDVSGELRGRLDLQGRQYDVIVPLPSGSTGSSLRAGAGGLRGRHDDEGHDEGYHYCSGDAPNGCVWAPQLHDGIVYASDMDYGLWALRFDATGTPADPARQR